MNKRSGGTLVEWVVALGCGGIPILIGLGIIGVVVWAVIRIVGHFCN